MYQHPPQGGAAQQQYAYPPVYGQQPYGQQQYGPPSYAQPQYAQAPQQTPYQSSGPPHGNGPRHNSFPPAKRHKGNSVLTRYPPPPGYRQPVQNQNQGPYGPAQHPPPQGYPAQQGYQQPPNVQPQGYQPAPNYQAPVNYGPPQGYQAPQAPQAPPQYQQGYPPPQGYPPQQAYPPQQPYQGPHGYQPPQGQPPHGPPPPQGYGPPMGPPNPPYPPQQYQQPQWQQPPPQPQPQYANPQHPGPYGPQPHGGPDMQNQMGPPLPPQPMPESHTGFGPNRNPTGGYQEGPQAYQQPYQPSGTETSHGGASHPPVPAPIDPNTFYHGWDDWDFDFDGALWPKGNDAVDPNFSIGIIVWHPAGQVTRALPSTFLEAEELAQKPPPKKIGNAESVSKYFTLENSHEAFLNVRQTDDWPNVKDDPIFVEFPMVFDLIAMDEVIANRNRPDVSEEAGRASHVAMDIDSHEEESGWNVMDNLEQALSSGRFTNGDPETERKATENPVSEERKATVSKDEEQEDILARLGVTGSPKPVKPGPSMPYFPPRHDPDRRNSHARDLSPEMHGAYPAYRAPQLGHPMGLEPPPPPPIPERSPSYDPWTADQVKRPNGHNYDGTVDSPGRSEASQHTLVGSDFHHENSADDVNGGEHSDGNPDSELARVDSVSARKRSYDDSEIAEGKLRQHDDVAPKTKRRQPRVAAAYSRRW